MGGAPEVWWGARVLGKNDPGRGCGMGASMSPARVAARRGREPWRSVTRVVMRS